MSAYRQKYFPALAGLLWASFLFLDITGLAGSTWVKYASICLCCATALSGAETTDGKLVAAALCFTVAADWFLLVRDDNYELGIGLFIVVQLLYALRLYLLRGKKVCVWGLALRCAALLLPLLLFLLGGFLFLSSTSSFLQNNWRSGEGDLLSVLLSLVAAISLFTILPAWFYFSNLCINTAEAFAMKKRTFAWGLLLFVCCDVCVGACNLGLFRPFAGIGMWLFYLPSQVLIVLSQETEKGIFMKKENSKLLTVFTSFCLAVALLTAAVAVLILCRPFYYRQIESLGLAEATGFSPQVIQEAFDQVMDYLVKDRPFGTGELRWSQAGMAHFADCKTLFRLNFILLAASGVLLLLVFLLSRRRPLRRLWGHGPCFWAFAGMLAVLGSLGIWAVLDFTSLFTVFHTLFFPGKTNWVFDPRLDEIILILPEAFWARVAALAAGLALGGGALLAMLEAVLSRRPRYKSVYEELRRQAINPMP